MASAAVMVVGQGARLPQLPPEVKLLIFAAFCGSALASVHQPLDGDVQAFRDLPQVIVGPSHATQELLIREVLRLAEHLSEPRRRDIETPQLPEKRVGNAVNPAFGGVLPGRQTSPLDFFRKSRFSGRAVSQALHLVAQPAGGRDRRDRNLWWVRVPPARSERMADYRACGGPVKRAGVEEVPENTGTSDNVQSVNPETDQSGYDTRVGRVKRLHKRLCLSPRDDGYVCSRLAGHEGEHFAILWSMDGGRLPTKIVARWPQ